MDDQRTQAARAARSSTRSSSTSAGWRTSRRRLNRFERVDEKPFEAVAKVSEFNQRRTKLCPAARAGDVERERGARCAGIPSAAVPALGDLRLNPWLSWLAPRGGGVKANARRWTRTSVAQGRAGTLSCISASLDYYRGMRDAMSEAAFFQPTATCSRSHLADKRAGKAGPAAGRSARAAVRQGCAGAIERRRLCRGAGARGVPARAQGRAAAAVAAGAEAETLSDYAESAARPGAGPVAPHPRRAGRSSRATSRNRRSRPCRLLRDRTPTASGC